MGAPDIALKQYFSDKKRLADIFNYYCFDGREELQAEEIETKDSVASILITGKENTKYPVKRIRDVLASAQKDGTILLLLGIENQNTVHYGMPVRQMLYDALTYANQMEEQSKRNRRNKNKRKKRLGSSEFLSGLTKEEKLIPVITLIIYYGKKPWDGACSLADMLDMSRVPKEFHPYIQNQYSLNLLEVRKLRDYEKFHSDIREVFRLLSCDDDKEKMKHVIEQDERYQNLQHDAVAAIAALTSSKEIMQYANQEEKGEINMCKAIQDMISDGEERGRQEGLQEGRKEGIEQGIRVFIVDNMEENISKDRILQKLQRHFKLPLDIAEQYVASYYEVPVLK